MALRWILARSTQLLDEVDDPDLQRKVMALCIALVEGDGQSA